eukprot:7155297-Pyramimonas_sp.AAC.1
MLVLEQVVPAADIDILANAKCAICALHCELAVTDAGLGGSDDNPALGCIDGGAALSRKGLGAPGPVISAPGVQLVPPVIEDGRLRGLQKGA